MIDPGLKDKVVLITEVNNTYGIGAASVRAFITHEARVFLHFFRSSSTHSDQEEIHGPGFIFFNIQQSKIADEVIRTIHQNSGQAAAFELGQYGITVNVVALGPVQSGYITPEMGSKESLLLAKKNLYSTIPDLITKSLSCSYFTLST